MPKIKSLCQRLGSYHEMIYEVMQENEKRITAFSYNKQVRSETPDENGNDTFDSHEMFYCSHCKEFLIPIIHEAPKDEIAHGKQTYNVTTLPKSYECTKCHNIVGAENVLPINYHEKNLKYPIWAGFYDTGDHVKFRWIEERINSFHNKLQVEYIYNYINFNTKTGQTYFFEPYTKKGKDVKSHRAPWYSGPKIINCCYSQIFGATNYEIPQSIFEDLYECIYKKVSENFGYKPVHLKTYLQAVQEKANNKFGFKANDSCIKIEHIIMFNRFPNFNPIGLQNFINNSRHMIVHRSRTEESYGAKFTAFQEVMKNSTKKQQTELQPYQPKLRTSIVDKKIASIKNVDPDPIKTLMINYKIPLVKSLRKIILEKTNNIIALSQICHYFSDINNIRNIYKSDVFNNYSFFVSRNNDNLDKFMKEMSKKFGETIWATKIISGNTQRSHISTDMINDTAKAYYKIKTRFPNQELDLTGNIREMHDRITLMLDKIGHPNLNLRERYSEADMKCECEIDGYKFKLAEDTYELKDIGNQMHNCVGRLYYDKAYEHKCNIAVMMNNNKYLVCIELSGDMKSIIQAKTECNNHPEGKIREIMLKWIKKMNFELETYDISFEESEENKEVMNF